MDELLIPQALQEIFRAIQRANKYIDETAPWALAKDEANRARLAMVLYNLCEALRYATVLLAPFLPETADKMAAQLGLTEADRRLGELNFGGKTEYTVHKGDALFPRIDAAKELAELAARQAAAQAAAKAAEPAAAPQPAAAGRADRASAGNCLRRFLQGGDAGGPGADLRDPAREQKAAQDDPVRRRAGAHHPVRHRQVVQARRPDRPQGGHRGQPGPPSDDEGQVRQRGHGDGRRHRRRRRFGGLLPRRRAAAGSGIH